MMDTETQLMLVPANTIFPHKGDDRLILVRMCAGNLYYWQTAQSRWRMVLNAWLDAKDAGMYVGC